MGWFSLERKQLQGGLTVAFQYLKGTTRKAGEGLFIRPWSDGTRAHGLRLKNRFAVDSRKKFFT